MRFKRSLIMLLVLSMLALPLVGMAATANPSPGSPGYQIIPLYIPGALTATATPIKFKAPFGYRVIAISAYARVIDTSSGNETYTVDVQEGGTSLLRLQ